MTHIEYTPPDAKVGHTLLEQLEQIRLIRRVEKALDDKRRSLGVYVERRPWPDMQDIDFALGVDELG